MAAVGEEYLSPIARRERAVIRVYGLCKALNDAGADPQWSRKSLREYINETYEAADGLDALAFTQLGEMEAKLTSDLSALLNPTDRKRGD